MISSSSARVSKRADYAGIYSKQCCLSLSVWVNLIPASGYTVAFAPDPFWPLWLHGA